MIKSSNNLNDLEKWMSKNCSRKEKYYFAFNLKTNEWTVSDERIRATKNRIVRHPKAMLRKGSFTRSWIKYIGDAFGGFVCKSTVVDYFGKDIAEEIIVDAEVQNPYYTRAPWMKLYAVDKLIPLAKEKNVKGAKGKLVKIIRSKNVNEETSNSMRLSA